MSKLELQMTWSEVPRVLNEPYKGGHTKISLILLKRSCRALFSVERILHKAECHSKLISAPGQVSAGKRGFSDILATNFKGLNQHFELLPETNMRPP